MRTSSSTYVDSRQRAWQRSPSRSNFTLAAFGFEENYVPGEPPHPLGMLSQSRTLPSLPPNTSRIFGTRRRTDGIEAIETQSGPGLTIYRDKGAGRSMLDELGIQGRDRRSERVWMEVTW